MLKVVSNDVCFCILFALEFGKEEIGANCCSNDRWVMC